MNQNQIKQDFNIIFPIDPPFSDQDKPDEQFLAMVKHELNSAIVPQFALLKNPSLINLPLYSAVVRKTPLQQEVDYLVCGGAYIDQDGIISTTQCFKIALNDYGEGVTVDYQVQKDGETVEIDGEEITEKVQIIPDLTYGRHNHRLFEVKLKNNQYGYLAVGGIQMHKEGFSMLDKCELLVEELESDGITRILKWKEAPSLAQARAGFSGFSLNGKVYVFGGFGFDQYQKEKWHGTSVSEVFDGDKWTQLKFKWSLGLNNNLQACCTPISDNKILIVGGSNGNNSTNQLAIMDVDKLAVTSCKCKLSIGRAGAQSLILRKKKLRIIERTENNENEVEVERDLIVVFLGCVSELSYEIIWVKDWDTMDMELMRKEDMKNMFIGNTTGSFRFYDLQDIKAWTTALQAYPVLIY